MKKWLLIPLFFLLNLSFAAAPQGAIREENANAKAKKHYKEAGDHAAWGRMEEAKTSLLNAVKEEPKFIDAWWTLGTIYMDYLRNYPEAAKAIQKVIELDPTFNSIALFVLGNAQFYSGEYESSKKSFSSFIESKNAPTLNLKRAQFMLKCCDFAATAKKNPVAFEPHNLGAGINTANDEFFPAVTADEHYLYFTRHEGIGRNQDENIWVSERKDSVWQKAEILPAPINSPQFIEGAHCISPSGKYLFYTACERPDGFGSCDLYFSKRTSAGWDAPKNLGSKINKPGWDSQPCIAADGRTLYFASKRAGGYGGVDIWMSKLDDNFTWGEPTNLGPTINTEGDEHRPFIHPDNQTLYFSSDGHPGLGQHDFFYSKKDANGNWQEPVNLGYPINTSGDEVGIYISTDGKTAYYATNGKDFTTKEKAGFGGIDIYSFKLPESLKPKYTTYLKGKVYDKETNTPLKANIQLFDLDSGKIYTTLSSDASTGEFLVTLPSGKNYACEVNKENYLLHSENFAMKDIKKGEPYLLDLPLQPVKVGQSVVLNNVFFEINSFVLKDESKTELNGLVDLLKKNNSIRIELSGHTDNTGVAADNKTLSENRAKAVFDYLITKGIAADRLTFKGYGSAKPIADNTTEVGKAKNRRTEFMVLGN